MRNAKVRRHFEKQAQACKHLGSPFTARLCQLLPGLLGTSDSTTAKHICSWPHDPDEDALALRLCGSLHALVLSDTDAELTKAYPPHKVPDTTLQTALAASISRYDAWLCDNLAHPPQTNEVARAAMLLPGFLAICREFRLPLAVREIGSSAGLNLLFDRFHYRYGAICVGDRHSPVQFAPRVQRQTLPLDGSLYVMSRKGSDIAPIDITNSSERLRLASYVWPDQTDRMQRQAAAIGLLSEEPFTLQRVDAPTFVAAELANRPSNAVFVLFHSIMWQYMPEGSRSRIESMLETAGNRGGAPIAWLRMEPLSRQHGYATLRLTLWPNGETRDLARCDYHGRWIEWVAD